MADTKEPYVHSNYERVPGDHYPTIDKRCIYGLLEYFEPKGLSVDVCAPDGSGIIDTLKECGFRGECKGDAFADALSMEWIITNPPYERPLVDNIIRRQIQRLEAGEVYGLAILLRANFDFAKSRVDMFDHRLYAGQVKLRFRPWWSESRKAQPIHNYVWQLWLKGSQREHPRIYYSFGEPGLSHLSENPQWQQQEIDLDIGGYRE